MSDRPSSPAAGTVAPDPSARLTAAQIFAVVTRTGEDELKRSSTGLGLSGLAAGLEMGLTGLGSASVLAVVGTDSAGRLLASLLYPIGFIVVVVGRAQLFTENTLFPIVLVLDRHRHVLNTLRLWVIVFITNVLGALLFAALAVLTPALSPPVRTALTELGTFATSGSVPHIFWSAVIGGWIIALMAWLVSAARQTHGQVLLVYLLTFVVGAAQLAHCIAGSGESLAAVLAGAITPGRYLTWLGAATAGNVVGGVLMVSLLNYGQVIGSGRDVQRAERSLEQVESDFARRQGRRHGNRQG